MPNTTKCDLDQMANAAYAAVNHFTSLMKSSGDNTDERIIDLIEGLMHLSNDYGFKWDRLSKEANRYYEQAKGI